VIDGIQVYGGHLSRKLVQIEFDFGSGVVSKNGRDTIGGDSNWGKGNLNFFTDGVLDNRKGSVWILNYLGGLGFLPDRDRGYCK
jgi:hypothetical protein